MRGGEKKRTEKKCQKQNSVPAINSRKFIHLKFSRSTERFHEAFFHSLLFWFLAHLKSLYRMTILIQITDYIVQNAKRPKKNNKKIKIQEKTCRMLTMTTTTMIMMMLMMKKKKIHQSFIKYYVSILRRIHTDLTAKESDYIGQEQKNKRKNNKKVKMAVC